MSIKIDQIQTLANNSHDFIFWKDCESNYLGCNYAFAKTTGLYPKKIVGIKDEQLPWGEMSYLLKGADVKALNHPVTILQILPLTGNVKIPLLAYKCPLYNAQKKTIGIAGITTELSYRDYLAFTKILDKNLLNHDYSTNRLPYYYIQSRFNKNNLTARESECFFLLLRGKNYKQIAGILKISDRTVEEHIQKYKNKDECIYKK